MILWSLISVSSFTGIIEQPRLEETWLSGPTFHMKGSLEEIIQRSYSIYCNLPHSPSDQVEEPSRECELTLSEEN